MTTRVVINRPGPPGPGADGRYGPTLTTVYAGGARIRTQQPYESNPEAAGHTATVQRYEVHIPATAPRCMVGDQITVVDTGRRFTVAGPHETDFATAQRLLVDEVSA